MKFKTLLTEGTGEYYILYTFESKYPDFVPKRIGILFRFDKFAKLTGVCDGIFSSDQEIVFSDEQYRLFQKEHYVGNDDQLRFILKDDRKYNNKLEYIKTFDDLNDFERYTSKYKIFGKV